MSYHAHDDSDLIVRGDNGILCGHQLSTAVMIRASLISLLATAALLLSPAPVRSQKCFANAPFSEGPLRFGISRAKPDDDDVRTGHVALGAFDGALRGAFVDASYSSIKPL